MLDEDLTQVASQVPLPADKTGSVASEVETEAVRLRALELEESEVEREAEETNAAR